MISYYLIRIFNAFKAMDNIKYYNIPEKRTIKRLYRRLKERNIKNKKFFEKVRYILNNVELFNGK